MELAALRCQGCKSQVNPCTVSTVTSSPVPRKDGAVRNLAPPRWLFFPYPVHVPARGRNTHFQSGGQDEGFLSIVYSSMRMPVLRSNPRLPAASYAAAYSLLAGSWPDQDTPSLLAEQTRIEEAAGTSTRVSSAIFQQTRSRLSGRVPCGDCRSFQLSGLDDELQQSFNSRIKLFLLGRNSHLPFPPIHPF